MLPLTSPKKLSLGRLVKQQVSLAGLCTTISRMCPISKTRHFCAAAAEVVQPMITPRAEMGGVIMLLASSEPTTAR